MWLKTHELDPEKFDPLDLLPLFELLDEGPDTKMLDPVLPPCVHTSFAKVGLCSVALLCQSATGVTKSINSTMNERIPPLQNDTLGACSGQTDEVARVTDTRPMPRGGQGDR